MFFFFVASLILPLGTRCTFDNDTRHPRRKHQLVFFLPSRHPIFFSPPGSNSPPALLYTSLLPWSFKTDEVPDDSLVSRLRTRLLICSPSSFREDFYRHRAPEIASLKDSPYQAKFCWSRRNLKKRANRVTTWNWKWGNRGRFRIQFLEGNV